MKFFFSNLDIQSIARDLSNGLHRLSFEENFQAFIWDGIIEAGEEVEITNQLVGQNGEKLTPAEVIITIVEGPPTIARGDQAWNSSIVTLKNRASESTVTCKAAFFR